MDNEMDQILAARSQKRALTQDDVETLKRLASHGTTEKNMAFYLRMSPDTFRRIKKEHPLVADLVNESRAKSHSKIAERAYNRAMEEDSMTKFVLSNQVDGWKKDPAQVNIQNNVQNNAKGGFTVNEQDDEAFLSNFDKADLEHYANLPADQVLAILKNDDPYSESKIEMEGGSIGQEPPKMNHHEQPVIDATYEAISVPEPEPQVAMPPVQIPDPEPVVKAKVPRKPSAYRPIKPTVQVPPPVPVVHHPTPSLEELKQAEGEELKQVKQTLYESIISDFFQVTGYVKGTKPRDQDYFPADKMEKVLAKRGINDSKKIGEFVKVLVEKGVLKKRLQDPHTKKSVTVYCGGKLRK